MFVIIYSINVMIYIIKVVVQVEFGVSVDRIQRIVNFNVEINFNQLIYVFINVSE